MQKVGQKGSNILDSKPHMCYLDPVDGTMHRRLPHTPDTSTRSRGNLCLTNTTSIRLAILALLYLWFVSYSARGTTQEAKQERLTDQELLRESLLLREAIRRLQSNNNKLETSNNNLIAQVSLLQITLKKLIQERDQLQKDLNETKSLSAQTEETLTKQNTELTESLESSQQDQKKMEALQTFNSILIGVAGVSVAALILVLSLR